MQAAERALLQAELRCHGLALHEELRALTEGLRAFTAPASGRNPVVVVLPCIALAGLGLVLLRRGRRHRPLTRVLLPAAIELWRAWSSVARTPRSALPARHHLENE